MGPLRAVDREFIGNVIGFFSETPETPKYPKIYNLKPFWDAAGF